MRDPYAVLGVPQNASDDEIKKAYRALCRKYHPDVNRDNPQKAEEKFKEVGEAYRQIMDMRTGKSSSYSSYTNDSSSNADARLKAASVYIQRGYFREAINTLNSITERTALWYYLSAVANARLGNNILAREYARTAASMEPGNAMYVNLNAALGGEGGFYQEY
ncbi:MAG: DnaJ domain-containing protein, partial [Clostridia bacterium]|nr:DnaJ domain-containing protein [Clostridia bacterium]